MIRSLARLLVLCLLLLVPIAAQAHDARPLAVDIRETAGENYHARLLIPPSVEAANLPTLAWPKSCTPAEMKDAGGNAFQQQQVMHCPGGLRGQRLEVTWPGYNPALSTLFRLTLADGRQLSQLQPPDRLAWDVPQQRGMWALAGDYFRLGVTHIWGGIDHLLFVAGLLLLAGNRRRIVLAVTGFTIAHSMTLALSVLGLVRLPVPPVEAVIALSILFLAREILRPDENSLARRQPVLVAGGFGLLHGFGFASALREVGLPQGELATGLISFNLGVEAGQLAFISLLVAGHAAWLRLPRVSVPAPLAGKGMQLAGYALGIPAAFWLVERVSTFG